MKKIALIIPILIGSLAFGETININTAKTLKRIVLLQERLTHLMGNIKSVETAQEYMEGKRRACKGSIVLYSVECDNLEKSKEWKQELNKYQSEYNRITKEIDILKNKLDKTDMKLPNYGG